MVPVEKTGEAWREPRGCESQQSHHFEETVLNTCTNPTAMCFPPPMPLHSRIQIRFRQECFSTECLFMWYIFKAHLSVLMAAGLREVLLLIYFFSIMYSVVIRQIVYTFCLENVFCKPISCELSRMHILKLCLKHNYVLSCSHGTQFFQWLLCSEGQSEISLLF